LTYTNVFGSSLVKPCPFLQTTASLHSDLSLPNQKLMGKKTRFCPIFILFQKSDCFSQMHITI